MEYITVLDIKGKHDFKLFYYIHIVEILTNKGANSYKFNISKIGNLLQNTISNPLKTKTVPLLRPTIMGPFVKHDIFNNTINKYHTLEA